MSARNDSVGSVKNIKSNVESAGKKAAYSPLMEALARLGFGVHGLIYITMGLLALSVAFGKGGGPADQQGCDCRYW